MLAANIVVLTGVISFVTISSRGNNQSVANAFSSNNSAQTSNPVDKLTSYDVAANIAKATSLPEKTAIDNQAQSAKVSLAVMSTSDASVVSKPQIVATALKSKKDIKNYTVQSGEDAAAIAQKFGVTSDSIKWSNNLTTNVIAAGTKLVIPPVNGIVYTVKDGDTVQSLATKYKASVDQIVAYNDAEIKNIKTGDQIIIPGGSAVVAAPVSTFSSYIGSPQYGGNGYDLGYCTWWVALRRAQVGVPLPSNLGNASSWPYLGRAYGVSEGSTPRLYAAAVTSTRGEGHVVFVESVNDDGSIVISEMNHLGWNVRDTQVISASVANSYIYLY